MNASRKLGEVLISADISAIRQSEMPEVLVVLVGNDASGETFRRIKSDLIFVRSLEEFTILGQSLESDILVTSGGVDIYRAILLGDHLYNDVKIFWGLGRPFVETYDLIASLALPQPHAVCGFSGTADEVILETKLSAPKRAADIESFMSGVRIGLMPTRDLIVQNPLEEITKAYDQILTELSCKHLSLLQSFDQTQINTPGMTREGYFGSAERTALENKLIRLSKRYGLLEKRYNSLAKSRLGRLTLALWNFRRSGMRNIRNAKGSKA